MKSTSALVVLLAAQQASAAVFQSEFECKGDGLEADGFTINVKVQVDNGVANDAEVTLSMPIGVGWVGIGFGTGTKGPGSYAMLWEGTTANNAKGEVSERVELTATTAGTKKDPSAAELLSHSEEDGYRTVIMKRGITGADFNFPTTGGALSAYCAYGKSSETNGGANSATEQHDGQLANVALNLVDLSTITGAPTSPTTPPPKNVPIDFNPNAAGTTMAGLFATVAAAAAALLL